MVMTWPRPFSKGECYLVPPRNSWGGSWTLGTRLPKVPPITPANWHPALGWVRPGGWFEWSGMGGCGPLLAPPQTPPIWSCCCCCCWVLAGNETWAGHSGVVAVRSSEDPPLLEDWIPWKMGKHLNCLFVTMYSKSEPLPLLKFFENSWVVKTCLDQPFPWDHTNLQKENEVILKSKSTSRCELKWIAEIKRLLLLTSDAVVCRITQQRSAHYLLYVPNWHTKWRPKLL